MSNEGREGKERGRVGRKEGGWICVSVPFLSSLDTVSEREVLKLTDAQVKELEASFSPTQFPDQSTLLELAAHLELKKTQVLVRRRGVGGRGGGGVGEREVLSANSSSVTF